jgi:hypothetical protein
LHAPAASHAASHSACLVLPVGEMLKRRVLVSLLFYLHTYLRWHTATLPLSVGQGSSGLGDSLLSTLASRRRDWLGLHHLRSFGDAQTTRAGVAPLLFCIPTFGGTLPHCRSQGAKVLLGWGYCPHSPPAERDWPPPPPFLRRNWTQLPLAFRRKSWTQPLISGNSRQLSGPSSFAIAQ